VTVVTLSSPIGQGSTLLAVGHDGAVLRQIERPVELGAPAVVGRVAFVPWNNQYVSAIDVTDGAEIGRVLLREKTSHAWTSAGALYFGELGIFRFDEHIKDASHGGADHLALPATSLPGHPVLLRPASEPRRPIAGAADKVRLFARPSGPGAPLALDAARFYATYFRLVLGLTGDRGHLAWVHTHQAEVLGGAVAHGALVLCDAQGRLTTLDAKAGGEVAMGGPGAAGVSLGEPVESCIVQADGFAPPSMPADPGTLLAQITRALSDRDLELEAGQSVLLRELGTMPDAGATGLLLAIATDPRTAPATLSTVQAALASRRAGPGPMLTALARHYDFLHDVLVAPPVGTLARALAAMDEHRAAPLLIGHLLDPADGDADVRDCAQALVTLATPAEVPDLLRFFALYRAAPLEPEEIPQAVMAVGEALLRVGGPAALAVVDAAAKQPSTNPAVRAKLQALLDAESVQRAPRPTPGATLSTTPSTTPSSASRE
jgi:outer membrane protein assembly factor BamB